MTAPAHAIDCLCARRGLLSAIACAGISTAAPDARASLSPPASDFPDTPAAAAAEYYLFALSSLVMVRHCKRSYLFGKALADKAGEGDAQVSAESPTESDSLRGFRAVKREFPDIAEFQTPIWAAGVEREIAISSSFMLEGISENNGVPG